jgi:hypothetical protein
MKRVCSTCGDVLGYKAPFDDHSVTHGLCPKCFQRETVRLALHTFGRAIEEAPKLRTRLYLWWLLSRLGLGACLTWPHATVREVSGSIARAVRAWFANIRRGGGGYA